MKTLSSLMLVGLMLIIAAPVAWGAKGEINTTLIGKKAIKGYDPVAYFTDGKPVEGKKEFTYEWKGAKWFFASAEHRDQFKADPDKYAPRYGGYCAYAVAMGKTADIDPKAWKIVDGRLYLNYDQDIQKKWQADIPGFIEKANRNWPGVLK